MKNDVCVLQDYCNVQTTHHVKVSSFGSIYTRPASKSDVESTVTTHVGLWLYVFCAVWYIQIHVVYMNGYLHNETQLFYCLQNPFIVKLANYYRIVESKSKHVECVSVWNIVGKAYTNNRWVLNGTCHIRYIDETTTSVGVVRHVHFRII